MVHGSFAPRFQPLATIFACFNGGGTEAPVCTRPIRTRDVPRVEIPYPAWPRRGVAVPISARLTAEPAMIHTAWMQIPLFYVIYIYIYILICQDIADM